MDKEFFEIIKNILLHPEFQRRKLFLHHEGESVYDHCLQVSYLAYVIAKKVGTNKKDAAIAGLLHDFYLKPWQDNYEKKSFFKQHGFTHAKEASINAKKWFPNYVNEQVEEAIAKHMFPLNPQIPKYKVSYCVTLADKLVSSKIILFPLAWPKYLGLARKSKKIVSISYSETKTYISKDK